MAAKVMGTDVVLRFTDDQFTILCGRSVTFDIQRESVEVSYTNTGQYRSYIAGPITYTATMEGLVNISGGDLDMRAPYSLLVTGAVVLCNYFEEDTDGNTFQKQFYGLIESISEAASFDNVATFTVTVKGTGPINFI
jgi:predicted secreted protein